MRTANLVLGGLLLGALIGAWIVHLSERSEFSSLQAELVQVKHDEAQLGETLRLCLLARVEEQEKMKEPALVPNTPTKAK